ncbi:MAG: DNA-3-methyladenine glycosylase [Bryobacterales bacterium]|nr:DNA-3-methyladenine glycosylase [Bryobacterales bacterium]
MRDELLMREAERHLRASGKRMAALVDAIGPCEITYLPATFESVVRSIVSQQISIFAARSVYRRLRDAASDGEEMQPERILRMTQDDLRGCGLSAQKIQYIHDLAAKTAAGRVDFQRLPSLSEDEVIAELTQVKGIGLWTAQMFLIFSLRRPDIWPTGDLGIRNGVKKLHGLKRQPTPAETEARGRKWRPYGSIASWYLWRSIEPTGPF